MNVRFLKITYAMMTALLLAACTQDDEPSGNTLPEGKYPLEIASVTMDVQGSQQPWSADAPQTRVSESEDGMSSHWDWNDTEQIGVQLYADGDVATYTLNTGKTLTSDKILYWKNTQSTTVSAWYPVETAVSLANQKDKLAYVLKGSGTGKYDAPVTLAFTHALAKVRVVLQGSDKDKVNDVKIKSFTTCTHTQGEVSIDGATEDWITMQYVADKGYWEANVVPGVTIKQFLINGITTGTLDNGGITPQEAKVNTIELAVGVVIGGMTITEPGDYLMKGNYSQTVTIDCEGEVNLTLADVTGTYDNGIAPIVIRKGHPTLTVKGTNTLTTSGKEQTSISLASANAHLTLRGNGNDAKLILKVTDGNGAGNACIGGMKNQSCGNITIKNLTLTVDATQYRVINAAIIGSGYAISENATCGHITISNTDLTVNGSNSNVNGAVIGTGGAQGTYANTKGINKCGDIKITLMPNQLKDEFLGKLAVKYNDEEGWTSPEKVGIGSHYIYSSCSTGTIKWYKSDGTEIQ